MKAKSITYARLFSLPGYENEKIEVTMEIEPGENAQTVLEKARNFVDHNHRLNGLVAKVHECENIINNPDRHTGSEIKHATQIRKDIIDQMENTTLLIGG